MAYGRNPQTPGQAARDVMDRWIEAAMGNGWWPNGYGPNPATAAHSFPVDIYEGPDGYTLYASLPGANPEEVQITALNGTLSITCEVKPPQPGQPVYREMSYGQFRRDVRLPGDFSIDQAEATFSGGLLKLTLPKAEHLKPKSLRVKVGP
jgi:HSP20 family protein